MSSKHCYMALKSNYICTCKNTHFYEFLYTLFIYLTTGQTKLKM